MLTVGRMLSDARRNQGITLKEAEKVTKIRRQFLANLEKDEFDKLPGQAYIVGFIRNYSEYLKLNPERVLAIFRREYKEFQRPLILPKGLTKPIDSSLFTLTPGLVTILASTLLMAIFFVYLFLEYRFVAIAPQLSVTYPPNQQLVTKNTITVYGHSDPDAFVFINDQPVTLQIDGSFSVDISLTVGVNTITVVASNKFGKKAEVVRTIEYVPQRGNVNPK